MKELSISSLNATKGDIKGEVDLQWDSIDRAELYMIQYSAAGNKTWKLADIINKSSYTIKGLKTSRTYLFRVSAVSAQKQGPWSEAVKKTIGQ